MSAKVNQTASFYRVMKPRWNLINALLGGTETMRAAGGTYLPRYAAETESSYMDRLGRATLLNYFGETLHNLSSRPFSKPIKPSEDLPEELVPLLEDVDQQGNDMTAFALTWFREALAKGFAHVLVEFPKVDPEVVRTKADEDALKLRPYLVTIPTENLIAAYSEVVNGKERLTHIRFRETEVVRDGFDEVVVSRIRVMEPGMWQVWESRSSTEDFTLVDQGVTTLDFIPLVTFYTQREGFMLNRPPLMDLAHKNVEHWQSASDQRNVLTVARFPILTATGVDAQNDIVLGPKQVLTIDNANGKFSYLEHNGNAIEAGRKDLEDIKDEMAMLGVELLVRRTGAATATEKSINAAQAQTKLAMMALKFADSVELALHYMCRWMALDVEDKVLKVSIHTELDLSTSEDKGLDLLKTARQIKDISRVAYLDELKRRSILAPTFDEKDDKELLDEEGAEGLARMAEIGEMADNDDGEDDNADQSQAGVPDGVAAPGERTSRTE